jgi:eukaryotic-like serine/threonine-protein kinase
MTTAVLMGGGVIALWLANQVSNNSQGNNLFLTRLNSSECRIAHPTNGDMVKVRPEPVREAASTIYVAQGNKVLFANEEQGPFVKVELSNGTQGWVFNDQIKPCDSTQGNNSFETTQDNANTPPAIESPSTPSPD